MEDAETIYDYCIIHLKYKKENIFLFGRSIGSGPATHLAASKKVGKISIIKLLKKLLKIFTFL